MRVLGLNPGPHDAAAALVVDGRLTCLLEVAAQEIAHRLGAVAVTALLNQAVELARSE